VVFIGWAFFRSHSLHDALTVIGAMSGAFHHGIEGPGTSECTWLALALVVVLAAPNSLEIVARLRPKPIWAWTIVLLFLWTIYHFDQTTEFLYYQF
jgi:hypothetical protein